MTVHIINADVMDGLKQLADESVHCVATSPPYWGLQSYLDDAHPLKRFEIGQEPTHTEHIAKLTSVFAEVRRVLRSDGSLWLNYGDAYANDGKWGGETGGKQAYLDPASRKRNGREKRHTGLKPKDLIGLAWQLAFALRDDGWWLRSANVWAKPNGMPESTRDRPTVGHEYVFQLTKSETYYYGYEDVKLPPVPESVGRLQRAMRANLDAGGFVMSGGGYAPPGQPPHQGARRTDKQRGHSRRHAGFNDRWDSMSTAEQQANGAALRSVWWIAPANFPHAHYAVMPDELAALCVLAGCAPRGTVLDPFGGSGTVGLVANRLQRHAILIDLNPDNVPMAERRIHNDAPLFAEVQA